MPILCHAYSLDDFPVQLDVSTTTRTRHVRAQFGDGYKARRITGINPLITTWTLRTPPLPIENALQLENDLAGLNLGWFYWTPPGLVAIGPQQFILEPPEVTRTYEMDDLVVLAFSLEQWKG